MTSADEVRTVFSSMLCVFIALQLKGVIHWSWWEVMAPMWIPAAIAIPILAYESLKENS